jgi:hypothetical protein
MRLRPSPAQRAGAPSLLLALALIAGCDSGQPETPEGRSDASAVRLALLEPSSEMLMGSLEGTLQAQGKCLYIVESGTGQRRTLPAFHLVDLRWSEATRTLHAGASALKEGQHVILGGGEVADSSALRWLQPPDPSCDASRLFMAGQIEPAPQQPAAPIAAREPLRHRARIADPRPLESVTGPLLFENGCWVVASGPKRIAIVFPRETRLVNGGDLRVGSRRLREGETYRFVGDLQEAAAEKSATCNNLPASIAAGDVWPPQPERPQRHDSVNIAAPE